MTDERIDALLRLVDVPTEPDPKFVSATLDELLPRARAARVADMRRLGRLRRAGRWGLSHEATSAPRDRRPTPGRALILRGAQGLGLVAAAILLVIVAVRPAQDDHRPGALPLAVTESGVLRVGVTAGAPQILVGGAPQGFDVDVAREIGRHLGLGVQTTAGTVDELLALHGQRWDAVLVALPPGANQGGTLAGTPYLWRAGAIVASTSAPITRIADLAGRTICVVPGGEGAAWLDGSLPVDATADPVPVAVTTTAPTLDGCIARLISGTASAAIADWGYDVLAVPPGVVVAPVTPFAVPSAPRVAASEAGAPALLDAINGALEAMRADRTLANLSKHRFAGLDLTTRP